MRTSLRRLFWLIITLIILALIYVAYVMLRPSGSEPVAPVAGAPGRRPRLWVLFGYGLT